MRAWWLSCPWTAWKAAILLQENRAVSDAPIEIVGANFRISGSGWSWDGDRKEIEVRTRSRVDFSQSLGDLIVDRDQGGAATAGTTTIHSERLTLRTSAEGYFFEFNQAVRVESTELQLTSQKLLAVADAPQGREQQSALAVPAAPAKLQAQALRQIRAREAVVVRQADRVIYADEAEFFRVRSR